MKKIYLQKITQHGVTSYCGKIDPRELVRIAETVTMGEVQDAQRPLSKKRVKEIANYVNADMGILPNTLTIATKNNKIKIQKTDFDDNIYYCELPNKEDEYEDFADSIDVMDGQHRLYSFLPDIELLSANEPFEIGFVLFDKPSLALRRRIFISCNEKQEKVDPNLLIWFKEKLGLLNTDERRYFNIVSTIANDYPLKGHVIMSAEKIKNGVKSKEIMADLKKIKVLDFSQSGIKLTDNQITSLIEEYLTAWEKVVGFEFATSSPKDAGVAVKIAGLKYMIYVLPAIWDYSINSQKKFKEAFLVETIQKLISSFGVEYENFFTDEEINKFFRDRTMIIELSNKSIDIIKKFGSESFNPLD